MIGIFYGSSTLNTEFVSQKILGEFGADRARLHNVKDVSSDLFDSYSAYIFITSTWGAGDLQDDWEVFVPELEKMSISGKTVALVGLGDQKNYPERFCDGIGVLYDKVEALGARVVGSTDTSSYEFKRSAAIRRDKFVGLVIDEDNQSDLTDDRITTWVKRVRKELS